MFRKLKIYGPLIVICHETILCLLFALARVIAFLQPSSINGHEITTSYTNKVLLCVCLVIIDEACSLMIMCNVFLALARVIAFFTLFSFTNSHPLRIDA